MKQQFIGLRHCKCGISWKISGQRVIYPCLLYTSLHGPVLTENLGHYIEKYDIWSSYRPEEEGVVVAYTSVYGNTKKAAELLADKLKEKGCPNVVVYDLARDDMAAAVADAFRYSKLVLATLTYNAGIYRCV